MSPLGSRSWSSPTQAPLAAVLLLAVVLACHSAQSAEPEAARAAGTLLIVGGGLDDDSRAVYERFVALASARGPASLVIATAATGPEEVEVVDKTEALAIWAPGVPVRAIRRDTTTDATVAAIDGATGVLFTGGDQERITARYRQDGQDGPEAQALRRLLARGGVIAGCSAGDAMMGEVMLVGGGSATALGILPSDADPLDPPRLGPRIAPGMGFLPWAVTDSHFFERDRVGRLVAALEASGRCLGLAVGEDACVEVDLATGVARGVGEHESLLVDVTHLRRDGLTRAGLRARILGEGDEVSLVARLEAPPPPPRARPPGAPREVPVVEPGQNRQLASWRLFRGVGSSGAARLALDDWHVIAWATGDGEVGFETGPR